MAEDQSSKTEEPTSKRIQESRSKGQVAISNEIKSWFILLAGTLLLVALTPVMMRDLNLVMTKFITMPDTIPMDARHIRHFFARELVNLAQVMAPFFGVMVIVAIFASVVQTGLLWAPQKIKPEWRKVSVLQGFKRVFGTRAMVEFLKGLIKISIVAVVAGGLALPYLKDLELYPFLDVVQTMDRVQHTTLLLMAGTVAAMTVIAGLDFFYQKYTNHQQMKMTKQEVKDEYRQQEGDPMIKSRIRQLRLERARSRMMAAVPQADVVITNPTHYAVALEYKMDKMPAPKLIAKGVDKVAFRIREVAEENDIPVVENPPLARALYASVELDEEIPEEHYKAVAEVIGYVMRLKGKLPH
ncbi:MAG: flagellar biosynthesis protein FlhB [Rhodospirillales bacterium]